MAIAIYQATSDGRHHWAEAMSPATLRNLASGEWVLFDATPATPPPHADPLDYAVSQLLAPGSTSATAVAGRAAFVAGSVYNSDGTKSTTKKLHVKLTADGTDIDDLFIESVA